MLIMALDSATQGCSVAVWQDGVVLASRDQSTARSQAEVLVPMIQATLNDTQFSFTDMDLFAVTVGPGSFTGVRVGLATARGLSLATARPIAGVTTTQAIAWAVNAHGHNKEQSVVVVVLDTYRADIYVQAFLSTATLSVPLTPMRTLMPAAITDFLSELSISSVVAGNCLSRLRDYLPADILVVDNSHPQAWAVAAIAASCKGSSLMAAEPLYLRPLPSAASTIEYNSTLRTL